MNPHKYRNGDSMECELEEYLAEKGEYDALELVYKTGVCGAHYANFTALDIALNTGNAAISKLILDYKPLQNLFDVGNTWSELRNVAPGRLYLRASAEGHLHIIKLLASHDESYDWWHPTSSKDFAYLAAANGHSEILKFFIHSINRHFLLHEQRLVKHLLEVHPRLHRAPPNNLAHGSTDTTELFPLSREMQNRALQFAAYGNNAVLAATLLDAYPNMDASDAICTAVVGRNVDVLRVLLSSPVPSDCTYRYRVALAGPQICRFGHFPAWDLLGGRSPLSHAVMTGDIEVVRCVLDNGGLPYAAQPDQIDGMLPKDWADECGWAEVEWLLVSLEDKAIRLKKLEQELEMDGKYSYMY